jgi:hypothetical protein
MRLKKGKRNSILSCLALAAFSALACQKEESIIGANGLPCDSVDHNEPFLHVMLDTGNQPAVDPKPFSVSLFLPNQVPVFDSNPFLQIKSQLNGRLTLSVDHLAPLLEEIVPGIPRHAGPDMIYRFSLYLKRLDQTQPDISQPAAFTSGLRYDARGGFFSDGDGKRVDSASFRADGLRAYMAEVEADHDKSLLHFIFVPGSPFYAVVDSMGSFTIKLPEGSYSARLITFNAFSRGRVPIYHLDDSIRTDASRSFKLGALEDSVITPVDPKILFPAFGRDPRKQ